MPWNQCLILKTTTWEIMDIQCTISWNKEQFSGLCLILDLIWLTLYIMDCKDFTTTHYEWFITMVSVGRLHSTNYKMLLSKFQHDFEGTHKSWLIHWAHAWLAAPAGFIHAWSAGILFRHHVIGAGRTIESAVAVWNKTVLVHGGNLW